MKESKNKDCFQETGIQCPPGDAVSLVCPNPRDEVEVLLDRLALKGRHFHTCSLSVLQGTTKRNAKVPDYLTTADSLKQMLQWYVDIRSIVKKVSRSIEL